MGGMAAQIPIKDNKAANDAAMAKVRGHASAGTGRRGGGTVASVRCCGGCLWGMLMVPTALHLLLLGDAHGAAWLCAWLQVRADKLREVNAGHDGTWVAHPDLVKLALEVFNA